MKHLIATAAFTATLCACGPMRVCTPTETRCAGSFVEVCDADGQWSPAEDCAAVVGADEPAWVCCPVPADELGPAGHACLPPDVACPAEEE